MVKQSNRNQPAEPESEDDVAGAGSAAAASVLTLVKALSVIEAIAEADNPTVSQIATRVGLNRTTTHRLVQTLRSCGYIQSAPDERGFQIGLKVLPLAARQLDGNAVRLAALPHLSQLSQETGERTNLGVLFNDSVLYLAGVEKPSLPNMYSRFGKLAPVHSCSLGKAILAFKPEAEARALLVARPPVRQTTRTLVEVLEILADLALTRDRGYAIDDGEHLPGVVCVAAPIRDAQSHSVAAISVSGSNRNQIIALASRVVDVAAVISHVLAR